MAPPDEILPLLIPQQIAGFRAVLAATEAVLATVRPASRGLQAVPREAFDQLARRTQRVDFAAPPASEPVTAGLTPEQWRGLWRWQEDLRVTLNGAVAQAWLAMRPDPGDAARYLVESQQLAALRRTARQVADANERLAVAARGESAHVSSWSRAWFSRIFRRKSS